jgi:ATP-binding cassette, subfamily C (CFTR/MRP), member 1
MLEIKQGQMVVEGVDLGRVPRNLIRQRCFITVSQDPFVLPKASLYFNLAPFGTATHTAVANILRTVGLWHHFTDHKSHQTSQGQDGQAAGNCSCDDVESASLSILDTPVSSLPVLSGGQLQLLAIARALVQARENSPRKGIVLLDEITSSLDPVTETLVYNIVQREFVDRGHTIIMVTHKLGAFASRLRAGDAVVWMARGRVERVQSAAEIDLS